ncbi:MAG: DegT/DnrJ/EryC1/StrS family aminotransferase [Planctomycetota bacterium]|jgi:dTDP-4-amino-4,6-dideoxygalactose transaminase
MKQIPMLDLKLEYEYMKEDIDGAIKQCLEHQRWILGPEVKQLEDEIAGYLGVKHCVGACSGTESLVLSLRAQAIKSKKQEFFDKTDEIITTSFTFTATGDAILRSGATPVFVDIDPGTYNIDTEKINEYIKANNGVIGILPVHLYGQSCNMDEIIKIAEENNFFVIEDVAQAFGGKWNNKKLGAIGTAGAYSFFPSKNLGGFGDGGMVATNDDETMELVCMLLRHGGKDKYNVDHIGYNARIDTLQAAIILAKFKYIDDFNNKRREIAQAYNEGLKDIEGIVLPKTLPETHHVCHQYTVRVLNGNRDELQKALKDKGISTMIYYPFPLHKMKVFGDGRSKSFGRLNNSEQSAESVLSLPVEPLQVMDDTSYVVRCIKEHFENS